MCFLECFDTCWLADRKDIQPVKKPGPLILIDSLLEQMEAEEETADPGSAKKQPLNVHETKQLLFSILELLRAGRRCPEQNIEGKLQQGLVEARWLSKH